MDRAITDFQFPRNLTGCLWFCHSCNVRLCNAMNIPVSVSLLSGDRKPQIRFLGNHHSGSGNLYHKSFRM